MDSLKKATLQRLLVTGGSIIGTALAVAILNVLLTGEFKAVIFSYIADPKIAGVVTLIVYNFVAEIKNRYALKGRLGKAQNAEEIILL